MKLGSKKLGQSPRAQKAHAAAGGTIELCAITWGSG